MKTRVAILISGTGSNAVRLIEDMAQDHPAQPVLVLSNNPSAAGLGKARDLGVATAVVDSGGFGRDRAGFEASIGQALAAARPDILCLAGFMRILSAEFVETWRGKILNIHPSLLPKFRGLNTHARVLGAGETEHGCTVHEVTADLDDGPILGQARVPVLAEDTAEELASRVLRFEHKLYPAVLRRFAMGDRTPIWLP